MRFSDPVILLSKNVDTAEVSGDVGSNMSRSRSRPTEWAGKWWQLW